jgi:hypothetical protein
MVKQTVGLSLDKVTIQKLDQTRGLIPRSAFVEKVLCEKLGD